MDAFRERGLSAAIVTHGPQPVTFYAAADSLFAPCDVSTLPVSRAVAENKKAFSAGDTTGCGDNFAGGVLAAIACQMSSSKKPSTGQQRLPMVPEDRLLLPAAVAAGICAGGAARFHLGGVAIESQPGERRREIGRLYDDYRRQIAGEVALPDAFLG